MGEIVGDAYLVFFGWHDVAQQEWNVDLSYSDGSVPSSGSGEGDFYVSVHDENGDTIYIRYFDPPSDEMGEDSSNWSFTRQFTKVPVLENTRAIRINRVSGAAEWEHLFSDEIPEVRIVESPSGVVDGLLSMSWEGSDSSGRPLRYNVQYSYYEGNPGTWGLIGSSFIRESHSVRVYENELRGSVGEGGRFRVIAYNGVNFSVAESDFFKVPVKPPEINVLGDTSHITLAKGRGLAVGVSARLSGPDGRHIPEDNITWHSDRDGFLSRGPRLRGVGNLSAGHHNIYVQVEDSIGQIFTQSARSITVVDDPPQITVRVGDGTDTDLGCNEIEVNVVFPRGDIDGVRYGFNLSRDTISTKLESLENLPIRYQMIDDTDVNIFARDQVGLTDEYREIIPMADCIQSD